MSTTCKDGVQLNIKEVIHSMDDFFHQSIRCKDSVQLNINFHQFNYDFVNFMRLINIILTKSLKNFIYINIIMWYRSIILLLGYYKISNRIV